MLLFVSNKPVPLVVRGTFVRRQKKSGKSSIRHEKPKKQLLKVPSRFLTLTKHIKLSYVTAAIHQMVAISCRKTITKKLCETDATRGCTTKVHRSVDVHAPVRRWQTHGAGCFAW